MGRSGKSSTASAHRRSTFSGEGEHGGRGDKPGSRSGGGPIGQREPVLPVRCEVPKSFRD